jgi:hypothetical protein
MSKRHPSVDAIGPKDRYIRYPELLKNPNIRHMPICTLEGEPFTLDLSNNSSLLQSIDTRDPAALHDALQQQMRPRYSWGLGRYLERREMLLRHYPQMVEEKRFYHLGLDVVVSAGTIVCAPLDADVAEAGYEPGDGNYGGYVLLSHRVGRCERFYSFFGHLSVKDLPRKGVCLGAGDGFARIGDFQENGNWYHHTHLQVITEKGLVEGFLHKGYCTEANLHRIQERCPDPRPLLTGEL